MEDAVNPYQPPDGDFAPPPPAPRPGEGPIVLRGPYDTEELDYESPEVESSVVSRVVGVATLLVLLTAMAPQRQQLLYVAPLFVVGWVGALWVERTAQRAAEARFRDQRLDLMEQISVDETGVAVTIEGEVSVAPWDRLSSVKEEPDRLILSGPAWFWLPLPRRRLVNADDWDRLVHVVRDHLPEAPEETAPAAATEGEAAAKSTGDPPVG